MTSPAHRYRIMFAKTEAMRYTSHLDLQRTWERTCRRADLPLAFTQGYHPHARMVFAAALPLGITGREECLDLWLREPRPASDLADQLTASAPGGLGIVRVDPIESSSPSLAAAVVAADYEITLDPSTDFEEIVRRIGALLGAKGLQRERRGKTYDLRPLIERLETERGEADQLTLKLRLAARPSATGRADEVISALGLDPTLCRACRTRLILS